MLELLRIRSMATIGSVVRWLREHKGWSQRQLAKKARTSDATICRVEQRGQDPALSLVQQLARAFRVPTAFLLHPPDANGRAPATVEEARQRVTAALEEYLVRTRRRVQPARGWIADDDFQDIERAVLQLVQLDPTVVFDRLAAGYSTLNFLMARAYRFTNRRFFEQLGAVLPCALIEEPLGTPNMTEAEMAAEDAAVVAEERTQRQQEEAWQQEVLTEWRQILESRQRDLTERLDVERSGRRFLALRKKLHKLEEALRLVQKAPRVPAMARLAEFQAQRRALKQASH
jgi:transcriptional regulator with XRE-family HTH domain